MYSIGQYRNYSAKSLIDFTPSPELDQIVFGSLLGDGSLRLGKNSVNALFSFVQSTTHTEYFMALFSIFSQLNLCAPSFKNESYFNALTNKTYYTLRFHTYSIPYFTNLYYQWYANNVKVIPFELINLLTPLALAHWICQDGNYESSGGLRLATHSFTLQECTKLTDYLTSTYNLKCSIQTGNKAKTQYRIYVSKHSMASLRELVLPHMVGSMHYKLGC